MRAEAPPIAGSLKGPDLTYALTARLVWNTAWHVGQSEPLTDSRRWQGCSPSSLTAKLLPSCAAANRAPGVNLRYLDRHLIRSLESEAASGSDGDDRPS